MKRILLIVLSLTISVSALTIPSGSTDRVIALVAASGATRITGLSTFTVYYKLDDGSVTAMTTPTVSELDATNMPGDYQLLIDESGMTTLDSAHDQEELILHISASGMDDVTRVVTIERTKFTEGQTITAANSAANSNNTYWAGAAITESLSTLALFWADANAVSLVADANTAATGADPNAILQASVDDNATTSNSLAWYLKRIFGKRG